MKTDQHHKVPFNIDLDHCEDASSSRWKNYKIENQLKTGIWWLNNTCLDIHSKGVGSPKKHDDTLFWAVSLFFALTCVQNDSYYYVVDTVLCLQKLFTDGIIFSIGDG